MPFSSGLADFKYQYEISPIYLIGGMASTLPGGAMPIVSLLQPDGFSSITLGGADITLDDYFAHFVPLPGGKIVDNQIGNYPFANQQVAANGLIFNPLVISLAMICPIRENGYDDRQARILNLKYQLKQHMVAGGTFDVITPAVMYASVLLTNLQDISSTESKQVQYMWQWDFVQPLLTLNDAQQAQNTLLGKISNQTQITDLSNSSVSNSVGNPNSGATNPTIPASSTPITYPPNSYYG